MSHFNQLYKCFTCCFEWQVTANSVRLVSCTSRELVDQWNAPAGFSVNVASANASQVLFLLDCLLSFFRNIGWRHPTFQ
jgi:hypothetical protein